MQFRKASLKTEAVSPIFYCEKVFDQTNELRNIEIGKLYININK